MEGTGTETLHALEKTFAIIETLAEENEPVGVSTVATRLDLAKSTTYKHLATLQDLGYVRKSDTKYALAVGFAEFGEHVKHRTSLYRNAKPHVDRLVETTNETAGLVVRDGYRAVDVYQATTDVSRPIANSRYFHCSAPGKAILAELADATVADVVDETGLPRKTEHTITDRETFRDELASIDERGIAFERREQRPDVHSAAISIDDGSTVGAVYVSGHADRLSSKRLDEDVPGVLLSTARRIEAE